MAKLVIKTPGLPAEVIPLKSGRNRFGRSSENDFQIQHDTISRFHCEVEVQAEAMFVRDLDSSNGTFVDDQPVNRAPLEDGQILRLGDVLLEVKESPRPVPKDEMPPCFNHPKLPASMACKQCHRKFCGACIHLLKRTGGQILRLCPVCSGHCEALTHADVSKNVLGTLVNKLFGKKPPEPSRFKE
ncbi:MAG: hypothetical protein RL380_1202 [Verrucomicrobiota bacterium]